MKTIEFLVAFAFLWFISTVMTGQVWVWPLAFILLCICALGDRCRDRRRGRERVRIHQEKVRQMAHVDPYPIIAATVHERRMAERDRLLAAVESVLTDEAIVMLCNPN